ncbi:hypothetical protein J26TS2_27980 [Shouchella clausii]|uniref:3'-5' exonuclease n=1 Tax=Shouchella tritolerans TaxID=2979466 RepID=UPI000788FEC0|nr:3'-5' exonuclease [Shouchella tritolerans]GIN12931.1 hypothetical protein J26TS2_27980 [Shouchella clausii]
MMNNMMQFMRQLSNRLGFAMSASETENAAQMARFRRFQKEAQLDVLHIPFAQLPIVVFDLETSGFHPDQGDGILSIGAVKVTGNEVHTDHFYETIKPKQPPCEEVLRLTGLSLQELDHSPPINEVLLRFYDFTGAATLVAHHAAHERKFMRHATWQELGRTFTHRLIDTTFLTNITAAHQQFQSLDEWCDAYGIAISQRHHALADARMTAKLWAKHITLAEHAGYSCLGDIYKELALRK